MKSQNRRTKLFGPKNFHACVFLTVYANVNYIFPSAKFGCILAISLRHASGFITNVLRKKLLLLGY